MVTFLKDFNNSNGQERLRIFDHTRDSDHLTDGCSPRDGDHHRYDDQ